MDPKQPVRPPVFFFDLSGFLITLQTVASTLILAFVSMGAYAMLAVVGLSLVHAACLVAGRRHGELLERAKTLYPALAHGDEAHQAWLKEKLDAHFAGHL